MDEEDGGGTATAPPSRVAAVRNKNSSKATAPVKSPDERKSSNSGILDFPDRPAAAAAAAADEEDVEEAEEETAVAPPPPPPPGRTPDEDRARAGSILSGAWRCSEAGVRSDELTQEM